MSFHRLLKKQVKKFLPEALQDHPELQHFLNAINESYAAFERDAALADRAFRISEEEYIDINNQLKHEASVKKQSLEKLKEAIGTITGEEKSNSSDDLLMIARYLNQQVNKRKSAELIFSSLITNIQSAILLEDETRHIVFTNQRFCDMFSIPAPPLALQGADCSNSAEQSKALFKDPEVFVEGINTLLQNRELVTGEVLELADGRVFERDYIPIFLEDKYKGHFWSYTDVTEKKKAQDVIEKSELTNRLILNAALDAIVIINEHSQITFWNPQAERIFGWKEAEVLGKELSDIIIPEHYRAAHKKGMANFHATGHGPVLNKIIEITAINKQRTSFPIELSIIPVKQESGIFFCGFIRDISERKKAESDLKESQELWQFALEGAGDGVWEYDFETEETFFSGQYKRMLGYEEDEFKNDHQEWYNRVHPDDLKIISQTDEDYFKNKITAHQREYRMKHKDGAYRWILDRGMVVSFTEEGKPKRIIGTHTDLTERKLTEQAIIIKEEKYRSIIANMNLGLLEVDNQEIIQFANQSFCDMSGYSLDELMGKKASALFAKGEAEEIIETKNELRKKGVSDAYEISLTNKEGEIKWWLISGAPRYNDNGDLVGSIGIHLDITQQKLLELELVYAREQAESSVNAKQTFLANMSHEIRTPMNAILGMTNQLGKTLLDKDQHFYLNTIHSAADNLLIIINDILDLSKIDAGKLSLEKIGFEPKNILNRVMQVMMHRAEEKGLNFSNSHCDAQLSPVLLGDPYRLNQVMLNLVSNAIKFTQKGSVDITCKLLNDEAEKQTVQITVTDTGIGMDEAFAKNLFEKFSQEDNSIIRKYGGTGLGMSICKELVSLMNGKIEVASQKGVGTSISVIIEFEKGTIADIPFREMVATDTSLLKGKKILVTDDNEMNQLVASTILQNFGAEITSAYNGKEAVQKIRENVFDIVLMDVQMPEMDGIEATHIIRETISTQLPVIALTAFAINGDNQKCLDAGMNDYLSKPFEESQLLNIITKWLGKSIISDFNSTANDKNTNPLYDLAKLEEISRGNKDFVEKMIRLFVEQVPASIEEMQAAYLERNFDMIKKVAHRIKPSIDNMGVSSLKAEIREIETLAMDNTDSPKLIKLIQQLDSKIKKVVDKLRQDFTI